MKTRKHFLAAAVAFAIVFTALASPAARAAQDQPYGALERGYRTGYSDGYQSGWSDQSRGASADYRSKEDYRRADRAYAAAYGPIEDYSDGYRQGFETGYRAGYGRRGFDSNLPAGGVQRRGAGTAETSDANDVAVADAGRADDDDSDGQEPVRQEPAPDPRNESVSTSRGHRGGGGESASGEMIMLVELRNRLSTDVSQTGDRFEARVLEPQQFAGATVAGRLRDVQRSGKAKGRALLQLDFEQIQMPGGGWQNFSAQVVEVLPTGGDDDTVGEVDPEGGVRGRSTTKDDVAKVGAAAGVGAIIGAIAGGGKGAVIGAVIGGGAGGAGVMTQRGKDVRLEPGQQLRIRAANVPR
ncbi:MAG TPA: hypothetical protein VM936_00120 [Pyrinomonadaceae bacterium]|nr:hypothetical protein [Pyrinomonadaceae bacterium]